MQINRQRIGQVLLERWRSLGRIGDLPSFTIEERRVNIYLNQSLVLFLTAHLLGYVDQYFRGNFLALLQVSSPSVILFIVALFSQYFHYHRFARLLALVGGYFLILTNQYHFGSDIPVKYALFLLTLVGLIILKSRWAKALHILIVIGIFALGLLMETWPVPYPIELDIGGRLMIFGIIIFATVYSFSIYYRANRQSEERLRKVLNELRAQNASLENYQKEVEQKNQVLAEHNEELERFAYLASHDLKTPLRSINGFLALLERRWRQGATVEEVEEFITLAKDSTVQMHRTIEGFLAYSGVDHRFVEKTEVSLSEVMRMIRINMGLEEQSDQILETEALPVIRANQHGILSIFQNLVENGFKYNHHQPARVKISYSKLPNGFCVNVDDNGIGVEEEFREKIFGMFQRLHADNRYEGSGIGLAVCRKLVKQLGGTISVSESPLGGSRFTLSFPEDILLAQPKKEWPLPAE